MTCRIPHDSILEAEDVTAIVIADNGGRVEIADRLAVATPSDSDEKQHQRRNNDHQTVLSWRRHIVA
jgi:hypothetical protein